MRAVHRRPGRVTAEHACRLGDRLTDRDRRIALDCYDHRVLTSHQLHRLHFRNLRLAQRRLALLYELRVLDRFRPPWQRGDGSTPYHWILDEAGAHIVAHWLESERQALAWRRDTTLALAHSSKLQHQLEVNEFFSRLAEEARTRGGGLREWWGERRCHHAIDGVTPDGYGHITLTNRDPIHFLLELDRGTEDHKRLLDKAHHYAKAIPRSHLRDRDPVVILAMPSQARAERAALHLAPLPVAAVPLVWTPGRCRSALAATVAASDARVR